MGKTLSAKDLTDAVERLRDAYQHAVQDLLEHLRPAIEDGTFADLGDSHTVDEDGYEKAKDVLLEQLKEHGFAQAHVEGRVQVAPEDGKAEIVFHCDPGQRFKFGPRDSDRPWLTVVGVVGNMRRQGLENEPVSQMFEPLAQNPPRGHVILVRSTAADPLLLAPAVEAAVHEVDRAVPVYGITTIERQLADYLAPRRLQTTFVVAFSAMALLIAAIGIYGLVQYSVTARTRDGLQEAAPTCRRCARCAAPRSARTSGPAPARPAADSTGWGSTASRRAPLQVARSPRSSSTSPACT